MKIIAIWHTSISAVSGFTAFWNLAAELVCVVPDSEMPHSFWGFYRVNQDQYDRLTSTPRLTWK